MSHPRGAPGFASEVRSHNKIFNKLRMLVVGIPCWGQQDFALKPADPEDPEDPGTLDPEALKHQKPITQKPETSLLGSSFDLVSLLSTS